MRVSAAARWTVAAFLAAMSLFTWAQSPAQVQAQSGAQTLRPDRPLWSELTPGQQTVLAPIEKSWDENDGQRKRKWVELAARYPKMSEQEQSNAQKRIADWAKLTPEQRRSARQNFQTAQQVEPDRRAAKWEAYQALPDEEKRRLAEQRAAKAINPKATAAPAPIPRPQMVQPGQPGHHAQSGRREPARLAGTDAAKPTSPPGADVAGAPSLAPRAP